MGFKFCLAQATGVTFFDVRFKGGKVLYELGLQEALSQYVGSDLVQGAAKYSDSFWGMSSSLDVYSARV